MTEIARGVMPFRVIRLFGIASVVVVLALVTTAGARGAASPVSPPPGAVVSSHPLFAWTLPPGEQQGLIYIANSPAATPRGQFFDENVVHLDLLNESDRRWSPDEALFAGSYWWNIRSTTDFEAGFEEVFSPPSPFTVAPTLRLDSVRLRPNTNFSWIQPEVAWTGNVHDVQVTAQILRRGHALWSRVATARPFQAEQQATTEFQWLRPRAVPRRTRLTFRVRVAGAGLEAVRTVSFRAP